MPANKESVSVKDLILKGEDLERLSVRAKKEPERYVYDVVMESGCDFAIERSKKGRASRSRLVILVSQQQYYIESCSGRVSAKTNSIKSFLSGLPKGEKVELPNVSWIDHLENDRDFCSAFYGILSRGSRHVIEHRLEMIRHGDFFFLYDLKCFGNGMFGELRYTPGRTKEYLAEYAPYQGAPYQPPQFQPAYGAINPFADDAPYNGGFGNQDGAGLQDHAFFDRGSVRGNLAQGQISYMIRLFGGAAPARSFQSELCYRCFGYERFQEELHMLSPALYKYMVKMLADKRGVSKKRIMSDVIPNWETQESMLFQSFVSFVMIGFAFGLDVAKAAMRRYMESDIRDILPTSQMMALLYGVSRSYVFDDNHMVTNDFLSLRNSEPLYELNNSSFLKYLFETSAKEGYKRNMGLFLYHWGQALFLQNVFGIKNPEKYPRHLACKNVELMSKTGEYLENIEKNIWKFAAERAKPLEYTGKKYKIIVPESSKDLEREAMQQQNCLGSYESRIIRGETRVCFLRENDPETENRSLVTIEVGNLGNVIQCKARFNRTPSVEIWKFILEWENAKKLTDNTGSIPRELLPEDELPAPYVHNDPFNIFGPYDEHVEEMEAAL